MQTLAKKINNRIVETTESAPEKLKFIPQNSIFEESARMIDASMHAWRRCG